MTEEQFLRIVVRGDSFFVAKIATSRGIPLMIVGERRIGDLRMTIAHVALEYKSAVAKWFTASCEKDIERLDGAVQSYEVTTREAVELAREDRDNRVRLAREEIERRRAEWLIKAENAAKAVSDRHFFRRKTGRKLAVDTTVRPAK